MKIGGMGGLEIVIILVVILLIFGPKNLPKLGSAIGKTVSNLRSGMNEGKKKKEDEADADAATEPAAETDEPKPAEIEGVVEDVEETADNADAEIVEQAEQATVEAEAAVDEAFQPKKVKRVVKKKVE